MIVDIVVQIPHPQTAGIPILQIVTLLRDKSLFAPIATNLPNLVTNPKNKEIIESSPSKLMGNTVVGLPTGVESLYTEARRCSAVEAYTAVVLTCRKILMHIAVSKGAPVNKTFIKYVDYLSDNHYIPPGSELWVDHIRKKSNEANHEIIQMGMTDSEDLISFTEMLLRMIYEFPARLNKDDDAGDDSA